MKNIYLTLWGSFLFILLASYSLQANNDPSELYEYEKSIETFMNSSLEGLSPTLFTIDSTITDSLNSGSIGGLLDSQIVKIQRAREVLSKIRQTGNFLMHFTGGDLVSLPVGISKTIGNVEYTMGIGEIELKPTHAELEIYVEIAPPDKDPLLFGATGVKFTKEGGIVGDAKIALLADFGIDLAKGKSLLVLKKYNQIDSSGTYVEVDCDGFKSLSVDAEVWFSRDWVKPYPVSTDSTSRVKGQFSAQGSSWDDIIATMTMDPFVIKGVEDISITVNNAIFDFSEIRHDSGVQFPEAYPSSFVNANLPLWKGVYLGDVSLRLPDRITGAGHDVEIAGHDIIIDDLGFTGVIEKTNPTFTLDDGRSANGWAISLDTFRFRIVTHQLQEVHFAGNLHVPLFKGSSDSTNVSNDTTTIRREDCLLYAATLSVGNYYNFSLTSQGDYRVDMWKADMVLEANSSFSWDGGPSGDTLVANLTGHIEISKSLGNSIDLNIPDLNFEDMRISNQTPYFDPGDWGVPDSLQASMGAFTMTVDTIDIRNVGSNTSVLDLVVDFNLTNNDIGINARGGFSFVGDLNTSTSRHSWDLSSFNVNQISINGSFKGVDTLAAYLIFFEDDDVYGTGFQGGATIQFSGINTGIEGMALFGTNGNPSDGTVENRYFFVDISAEFGTPINLGGVGLLGIGGGVYKGLSRPSATAAFSQFVDSGGSSGIDNLNIGQSLSGVVYEPSPEIALGVKASVVLVSMGDPESFNANVEFGMQFTRNDTEGLSVQRIYFQGQANFMTEVQDTVAPVFAEGAPPPPDDGTIAYVALDYNRTERSFQANLDVTFYRGSGRLRGNGWAEMYFLTGPDSLGREDLWYVYIGTPENRDSLSITIPLTQTDILMTAYFMMGNVDIPGMPPPEIPFEELGITPFEYERDANDLGDYSTGSGFVFGASLQVATEGRDFLIFYYDLNGGIGFDLSLLNYDDAECAGTNEPIGMNGWYAQGQLWAYLGVELGLRARVFKKDWEFLIMDLNMAMLMEAKLPNPFWARAQVAVNYNFLKGLIKGNKNVIVTVGEQCEIINDDMLPIDKRVITSITPGDGNVGVEVEPEVVFSLRPNVELAIPDLNTGENVYYKAELERPKFLSNGDQIGITGDTIFLDNYGRMRIVPDAAGGQVFLPENKQIELYLKVNFYKKEGDEWVVLLDENDQPIIEDTTIVYSTGDALTTIPHGNVIASYPIDRQLNLHKNQSNIGSIELRREQRELFEKIPEGYKVYARFIDLVRDEVISVIPLWHSEQTCTSGSKTFSFDQYFLFGAADYISFPFPKSKLDGLTLYQLDIIVMHPDDVPEDILDFADGTEVVKGMGESDPRSTTQTEITNNILALVGQSGGNISEEEAGFFAEQYLNQQKGKIIQDTTRSVLVSDPVAYNYSRQDIDRTVYMVMDRTQIPDEPLTKKIVTSEVSYMLSNNSTDQYGNLIPVSSGGGGGILYPSCPSDLPTAQAYGGERVLHTLHFRTSKYSTWDEKMGTFSVVLHEIDSTTGQRVYDFQIIDELFDHAEIIGGRFDPLVSAEHTITNDDFWYPVQMKGIYNVYSGGGLEPPECFSQYPQGTLTISAPTWRVHGDYERGTSFVPNLSAYISQAEFPYITDDQINNPAPIGNEIYNNLNNKLISLADYIMYQDFMDFYAQSLYYQSFYSQDCLNNPWGIPVKLPDIVEEVINNNTYIQRNERISTSLHFKHKAGAVSINRYYHTDID